jgi:hypothetical protein
MAESLPEANGLHIIISDEAIAHAAEQYAGAGNPRTLKRSLTRARDWEARLGDSISAKVGRSESALGHGTCSPVRRMLRCLRYVVRRVS